jgi:hypothetical protein
MTAMTALPATSPGQPWIMTIPRIAQIRRPTQLLLQSSLPAIPAIPAIC